MRLLALVLFLAPITASAAQTRPPTAAALKAEERVLRKQIAAITPEEVDMDLDANRFGLWMQLAENLAKQGKVEAAIRVAYGGAYEIPTRSADFRGTSRYAIQEAALFEERVRGRPTEQSTAALWEAGASRQLGISPVDTQGRIPAFSGYNLATIERFRAIGRHAEAHALASAVMVEHTEFRFRSARGSSQRDDLKGFGVARVSLLRFIRHSWDFSQKLRPEDARALIAAEALLDGGDAPAAEAAFRTFLKERPVFLVLTAVQSRARRGLARAMVAQGPARHDAAKTELRSLLGTLMWQSSRDDPRMLAVAAEYRALLIAGAGGDARAATNFDRALADFRLTGRMRPF